MNQLLPQTHPRTKRRKNLFIVSASLIALTAVLLTVLAVRQRSAKDAYYQLGDIKYGVHIISPDMEDAADRRRQAYIDKAERMRGKWEPWAREHRDLLARLVNAEPSDYATLAAVFDALPSRSEDAGLVGETGFNNADDMTNPKRQIFAYNFKPRKQTFSDANQEAAYNKSLQSLDRMLKENFDRFHDILLAQSVSPGRSTVTLWASGRITEDTQIRQTEPGKPLYVPGPPQEIARAYDFLK